jgi:hypothetical protein
VQLVAATQGFDIGALLTAAVAGGLISAIVTTLVGAWSAAARDRRADERTLRDRKAQRLRDAFKPVLHTARAQADTIAQQVVVWEGDTVEARDARLAEAMKTAREGLIEARLALQLEPRVGKHVDELFQEASKAYVDYQFSIESRGRVARQGGVLPAADLPGKWKLLEEAIDRLHAEMVRIIDELEPLPAAPRRRWWRRRRSLP